VHLARTELRTALGALIARFPTLQFVEEGVEPDYTDSLFLRGLRQLHVTW
jgi:cytochrome P450